MSEQPPLFTADDLRRLARAHAGQPPCPHCVALACPGWEALPGGYDTRQLRQVGSLRRPDEEDPTLEEFHPAGTNAWSVDAPIAPGYFPYNRCGAWQCANCGRPFLRYTEYGGYYVEERVRELRAELIAS